MCLILLFRIFYLMSLFALTYFFQSRLVIKVDSKSQAKACSADSSDQRKIKVSMETVFRRTFLKKHYFTQYYVLLYYVLKSIDLKAFDI